MALQGQTGATLSLMLIPMEGKAGGKWRRDEVEMDAAAVDRL